MQEKAKNDTSGQVKNSLLLIKGDYKVRDGSLGLDITSSKMSTIASTWKRRLDYLIGWMFFFAPCLHCRTKWTNSYMKVRASLELCLSKALEDLKSQSEIRHSQKEKADVSSASGWRIAEYQVTCLVLPRTRQRIY